jgi:hypothetical protein
MADRFSRSIPQPVEFGAMAGHLTKTKLRLADLTAV